jgi:hypothetical protein
MTLSRRTLVKLGLLAAGAPVATNALSQEREDAPATRTLGLEQGFLELEAPGLTLKRVRRYWEVRAGHLALRFELQNRVDVPVVIGALGIPSSSTTSSTTARWTRRTPGAPSPIRTSARMRATSRSSG